HLEKKREFLLHSELAADFVCAASADHRGGAVIYESPVHIRDSVCIEKRVGPARSQQKCALHWFRHQDGTLTRRKATSLEAAVCVQAVEDWTSGSLSLG